MHLETRQALNFSTFRQAHIHSLDSRTLKTPIARGPLRLFVSASQLEALGWLAIGASIGYFAQRDVQFYIEGLGAGSRFDEIGQYWFNLFDSDWLLFWLDQERTRPRIPDLPLEHSSLTERMFENCLLDWYRLNSASSAAHATAQLSFALPTLFSEGYPKIGREDLAAAYEDEWAEAYSGARQLSQSAVLLAGYGQMLEFLHGFLEQRNRFRDTAETSVSEGFFKVVARLLKWRFFFFQRQTTLFAEVLYAYCDAVGLEDAKSRNTFQRFIKSICNEWSDLQAPAYAVAGGK